MIVLPTSRVERNVWGSNLLIFLPDPTRAMIGPLSGVPLRRRQLPRINKCARGREHKIKFARTTAIRLNNRFTPLCQSQVPDMEWAGHLGSPISARWPRAVPDSGGRISPFTGTRRQDRCFVGQGTRSGKAITLTNRPKGIAILRQSA